MILLTSIMTEWQLSMAAFVLCNLAVAAILYPILAAILASSTSSSLSSSSLIRESVSLGSKEDDEECANAQQLSLPPSDFQRWFDEALQRNASMQKLSSKVKDHGTRPDECKEIQETNNTMFSMLSDRLNIHNDRLGRIHQVLMSQHAVA